MRGALAASLCVVALIDAVGAAGATSKPSPGKRVLTAREAALVATMNSVRSVYVLPKLRVDAQLVRAARAHSRDMLRRQYFAHGNFGRRMASFRIQGRLFAENLVWGSCVMTPNDEVALWLASPPHRENLLDPRLRRVGVATPLGSFGGFSPATVVTADFAG